MIFLQPQLTKLSEPSGRTYKEISLKPQHGQQKKPKKVEEVEIAFETL